METTKTQDTARRTLMAELDPIVSEITWGNISRKYMGKSPSWIYNKLRGSDGNGGAGGFSPEETEQLRFALLEFAAAIRQTAERL